MSDPDDSAERAPAGGVPPWHQPIEYNEDDDDEGPPEDLPDQKPQPNWYWFMNFGDELEPFDFNTAVVFCGKYPPHHDKILYNIPDNRWVLAFLDGLPGTATPPGVLATFENIEVSREFATVFITQNDQRLPDCLRELADPRNPLRKHPFNYSDIRQFYDACESRSAGRTSPPIATDAATPPKAPTAGAEKPPKKSTDKASPKKPTEQSFRCYKLYHEEGWDQTRIAKKEKVSQATVSKKIQQVEDYYKAHGLSDQAPHNKKRKHPTIFPVDPRVMDEHPERDGGGD